MGRTIYFEHIPIGRQVKVSAIDGQTGLEVSIVGPVGARPEDLESLALRKLDATRARKEGERDATSRAGGIGPAKLL